jgi:hypothetical protein
MALAGSYSLGGEFPEFLGYKVCGGCALLYASIVPAVRYNPSRSQGKDTVVLPALCPCHIE